MHVAVGYLIGETKYIKLDSKEGDRKEVSIWFENFVEKNKVNPEFVGVLMNDKREIITSWFLQTPIELFPVFKAAIQQYSSGVELARNPKITLQNIFGSAIEGDIISDYPPQTSKNLLMNI